MEQLIEVALWEVISVVTLKLANHGGDWVESRPYTSKVGLKMAESIIAIGSIILMIFHLISTVFLVIKGAALIWSSLPWIS